MKPFDKLLKLIRGKSVDDIVKEVEEYPRGDCNNCSMLHCPDNNSARKVEEVTVDKLKAGDKVFDCEDKVIQIKKIEELVPDWFEVTETSGRKYEIDGWVDVQRIIA